MHEPTNTPYCDPTCEPLLEFCGDEQECNLLEGECAPGDPCPHQFQCIDIESEYLAVTN